MTSLIVVFAKEPVPGQVKTRLAAKTSYQFACDVYSCLLAKTMNTVSALEYDYKIYLSPESQRDFLGPDHQNKVTYQVKGSLGEKMRAMFDKEFNHGYDKVVLVGSDCPDISQKHFDQAFAALDSYETVWGPTADGGYYLVGQISCSRELFEGVLWSSESVWKQTKAKLRENAWTYYQLQELRDVDTFEDLEDWLNRENNHIKSKFNLKSFKKE